MNRACAVVLASAGLLVGTPVGAAELMHFSVTQVRQLEVGQPVIRAYLDLADAAGQRPERLSEAGLTATMGEHPASLVNLTPAWTIQHGVAYIFLVDISKSLSPELFQRMVGGIETWVRGLGPSDRAAIITFGESSREIIDFTGDQEELLAALESLGPTDDLTRLHQALSDALDLSRRLDPDLPGRRVIVIFSDGKDEGSPFHAEDVMAKLRSDPAPIYAIGYSRLRDPDERRAYLDLLERFAINSGGTFFAAERTRFEEAYGAIRQAIGDVWIADFICASCGLDGSLIRLQVRVEIDDQALSSGGSVRLLPLATAASPGDAAIPSVTPPPTAELPAERPAEPETVAIDESLEPGDRAPGFLVEHLEWFMGGLAVLIGIALFWQLRISRERSERQPRAATEVSSELPPGPIDPRSEPTVLDPPMPVPYPDERKRVAPSVSQQPPPAPHPAELPRSRLRGGPAPKQVRLIVVRGSRKGRQYSFVVTDRALIGKRSDSTCILADEPGIDPEQFELLHEGGALYLRNLSMSHPTLVNGRSVSDRIRLSSDTLIGTGETVLRIVFH